MASIRKRTLPGSGRTVWLADYRDAAGQRRFKQFDRRGDADDWLVQARHGVASGTHTPEAGSATLAEVLESWIQRAESEELEGETLVQYRQHRAHILALIPGKTTLATLTRPRVERLRDQLLELHSRAMARKLLTSLKSALGDAQRRGLVAQNVAAATRIKAARRQDRRLEVGVDVPTPAEVKTMLSATSLKGRALVALAALAGLRASELRGLAWSSVDLGPRPTVTVSRRADRRGRIGLPKSREGQRVVPLGEIAARALREWKLAQPAGRTLVFGTRSDRPDRLPNLVAAIVEPLRKATGMRYSLHRLRHYAVSAWLAAGIDPKTAQTWAGHATLSLTLDTYGHMIPRADDHTRIAAAEIALG
jgi:integrase